MERLVVGEPVVEDCSQRMDLDQRWTTNDVEVEDPMMRYKMNLEHE